MAKRMHVVLEDDIDGSEATQTVVFGLDGVSYEIDLNDEHANGLRGSLTYWVENARRVAGRKNTSRKSSVGSANDIRKWASSQGIEVNARGRVPSEVREAYERAHS